MTVDGPPTLSDIEAAAATIRPHVVRTPLIAAPMLSARIGAEIWVKYETFQVTGAFKERGAVNRLASLTETERQRGVVTLSAGNHAQALACHASRLGIAATIVMPRTTPFTKVANTERFGARVVLEGASVAECRETVDALMERKGLTLVHPYDDRQVMAGQGTIALEMLDDVPELDCLVVPIGGGGLISGIAVAAQERKPGIEIIGVQSALYPSIRGAAEGGAAAEGGDTLAEGIAVKVASPTALDVVRERVRTVLTVAESDIEAAIYTYLVDQKTLAEGAGAAGLAALLAEPELVRGRQVGLVLTGGNIDPRLLSAIAVRALERDDRIVSLRIALRDRPGELGRVATVIGAQGANILEVSHQRMLLDVPAMRATADITIETRDRAHADRVIAALEAEEMSVARLDPVTRTEV
jgi:threonine dehydratase